MTHHPQTPAGTIISWLAHLCTDADLFNLKFFTRETLVNGVSRELQNRRRATNTGILNLLAQHQRLGKRLNKVIMCYENEIDSDSPAANTEPSASTDKLSIAYSTIQRFSEIKREQ